jgi:hypothetical protein
MRSGEEPDEITDASTSDAVILKAYRETIETPPTPEALEGLHRTGCSGCWRGTSRNAAATQRRTMFASE